MTKDQFTGEVQRVYDNLLRSARRRPNEPNLPRTDQIGDGPEVQTQFAAEERVHDAIAVSERQQNALTTELPIHRADEDHDGDTDGEIEAVRPPVAAPRGGREVLAAVPQPALEREAGAGAPRMTRAEFDTLFAEQYGRLLAFARYRLGDAKRIYADVVHDAYTDLVERGSYAKLDAEDVDGALAFVREAIRFRQKRAHRNRMTARSRFRGLFVDTNNDDGPADPDVVCTTPFADTAADARVQHGDRLAAPGGRPSASAPAEIAHDMEDARLAHHDVWRASGAEYQSARFAPYRSPRAQATAEGTALLMGVPGYRRVGEPRASQRLAWWIRMPCQRSSENPPSKIV